MQPMNPPEHSRRQFLKLTAALTTLLLLPKHSIATEIRELPLKIKRGSNTYTYKLVRDGEICEEAYTELCYIFGDPKANKAVKMDPQLFLILARGQEWLSRQGYNSPLIITSAYRSPETNYNTEGAARNSLHQYGRAVDIKYPGIPISYLAVLFRSCGAAGIGIYDTFLHIDTWKERAWVG